MNELRVVISLAFFCISTYLSFTLFSEGFSSSVLIAAIVLYFAAYFTWPSKSEFERESAILDLTEFILYLPFRAIGTFFRVLGKSKSDSGGGFDIDL